MRLLGTLELAALAGVAFALLTSLLGALLWPALAGWLHVRHPLLRARVAWLVAMAPGVLPLLLLALCFAPGLAGAAGIGTDHCLAHGHHPHLCIVHPTAGLGPLAAGLLGVALVGVGSAATREGRRLSAARRSLARLHLAGAALDADVRVVPSERPFSFAAGLLQPRIYVSTALREALGPSALAVVVEHERAHVRRRDPLRRLAAHLLSWPFPREMRRRLLDELHVATEQACDEAAGRAVGDRLCVAETILAAERVLGGVVASPAPALTSGFGEGAVAERVAALLAEPLRPPRRVGVGLAVALGVVLAAILADPVHHTTEHLLALLRGGI